MAHDDRSDLPEIEIVAAGPAVNVDPDAHVVGHDRLADVIAAFTASLEAIRASQGTAPPRHNAPSGSASTSSAKRVAQVVQATPVPANQVIDLLRTAPAQIDGLDLDTSTPGVGLRDIVFEGRLRMPGRTRRRIELRVYPTTSGNLTVLELLPRRHWMPQTSRYLRAGVPAITALTDRLEDLAGS